MAVSKVLQGSNGLDLDSVGKKNKNKNKTESKTQIDS